MTGCIFCKIVSGEMPCYKVYEDSKCLAFMDIFPKNEGHTLVIPKKHYEIITDAPDDVIKDVIVITKKLAKAVKEATNCDGFVISNNNGKHGGQEVPHIHFHIIPRFKEDGLKYTWPAKKFSEDQFRHSAARIKSKL